LICTMRFLRCELSSSSILTETFFALWIERLYVCRGG
jgi:hypothetical protein